MSGNPHLSTPLALGVQNLDLLQAVQSLSPGATTSAIAALTGRDPSNVRKSIAKLEEAGLLARARIDQGLRLGELGANMLAAAEVPEHGGSDVVFLSQPQLAPHPLNPRQDFDSDEALQDLDRLRESIVLAGRIRQNLEVRRANAAGVHFIIAGERRWRAVGAAIQDGDLAEDFRIPVRIVDLENDGDHLVDALDENLQRRDLHPLEEGRAYRQLVDTLGWSTRDVADRVGRSQKHVQDRIALVEKLSADDQARMFLPDDDPRRLTYTAARSLIQVAKPTPEPQALAVDEPALNLGHLSTESALILVEIALKGVRDPQAKRGDGWTQVGETERGHYCYGPEGALNNGGLVGFVTGGGETTAKVSVAGRRWFEERAIGLDEASLLAARRRIAPTRARAAEQGGVYATAWLNPPYGRTASSRSSSPAPDPFAKVIRDLTEAEISRLRQISERLGREPIGPGGAQTIALDDPIRPEDSGLSQARAIQLFPPRVHRPGYLMLMESGRRWLRAHAQAQEAEQPELIPATPEERATAEAHRAALEAERLDDQAVDQFGELLKAKLARARAKGRGGWNDPAVCEPQDLAIALIDHVAKGDPVDVAAFCMFLTLRTGPGAGDVVRGVLDAGGPASVLAFLGLTETA